MVRRWLGDWDGEYAPPHAIYGDVAAWARTLAAYRHFTEPMLGKRQARQWLKELGARRRAAGEGR